MRLNGLVIRRCTMVMPAAGIRRGFRHQQLAATFHHSRPRHSCKTLIIHCSLHHDPKIFFFVIRLIIDIYQLLTPAHIRFNHQLTNIQTLLLMTVNSDFRQSIQTDAPSSGTHTGDGSIGADVWRPPVSHLQQPVIIIKPLFIDTVMCVITADNILPLFKSLQFKMKNLFNGEQKVLLWHASNSKVTMKDANILLLPKGPSRMRCLQRLLLC